MAGSLPGKNRSYDKGLSRLRRVLLSSIPFGRSISIEQLVEMFPWARWSDVFYVMAQLGREGEIVFHRRGFDIEIWSRQKKTKIELFQKVMQGKRLKKQRELTVS